MGVGDGGRGAVGDSGQGVCSKVPRQRASDAFHQVAS